MRGDAPTSPCPTRNWPRPDRHVCPETRHQEKPGEAMGVAGPHLLRLWRVRHSCRRLSRASSSGRILRRTDHSWRGLFREPYLRDERRDRVRLSRLFRPRAAFGHHKRGWASRNPGWHCTIATVDFDLLDTVELNRRKMLGPDQYLHDPVPRARRFLRRIDHAEGAARALRTVTRSQPMLRVACTSDPT